MSHEERSMDLLRSLIFVPGIRENMIEKAHALTADVIVLDLEDSVPPAEKEQAREIVRRAVPALKASGRTVYVRVNPVSSGLTRYDLSAVVCPELSGITLPKADSAQDIRDVDVLIREQELEHEIKPGTLALIPTIESAVGVLNCEEICRASTRLTAITLGADDYTADLGSHRTREGRELDYARQVMVVCARAADIVALDTPFADFRDEEGLIRETEWVRSLGFRGKYLIHPGQIEPVNRIFRPTEEEVAYATKVSAAFDEALAQGLGAVQVDGRMVDAPVAKRARRLLELAQAIEAKEQAGASS
jgi:citrate lyase subunit beta/citryl-CoA lyase